jgi:hypothetical protein
MKQSYYRWMKSPTYFQRPWSSLVSSDWPTIVMRGFIALISVWVAVQPCHAGSSSAQSTIALRENSLFHGPTVRRAETPNQNSEWLGIFTRENLDDLKLSTQPLVLAARANLKASVSTEVSQLGEFATPYDGCDIDQYTKRFSYEYRSAARAASDLAVYSYVGDAGDPNLAAAARTGAQKILLSWATDANHISTLARGDLAGFCDSNSRGGDGVRFSVGLVLGRGVPYLVSAYSILRAQKAFDSAQTERLLQFFRVLYNTEKIAMAYRAVHSNLDCNRFSNHVSIQLAAMIELAFALNDTHALDDLADGARGEIAIPWSLQASRTVYREHEQLLNCYRNTQDPAHYFQYPDPQAGEIVDRYRASTAQTVGYPLFSLNYLLIGGLTLRSAGYDVFAPLPDGSQPVKAALDYYSELIQMSLEKNSITSTPKFRQYAGKLIVDNANTLSGLDFRITPFLLGVTAYPGDANISRLLGDIKATKLTTPFAHLPGVYLPILDDVAQTSAKKSR